MSKNITEIPFTEIVEKVCELGRERADVSRKIRGIVNDHYSKEIPREEDWSFMVASSSLTLIGQYNTGTISATTASSTVTFVGATIISDMTGRKIKISGNDFIYDFTFTGTTSGTINPPLSGNQNYSGVSFSIFQPFYPLANDFDRFLKDKGVTKIVGGRKEPIKEMSNQEFDNEYTSTPALYPRNCRLNGTDTSGKVLVEFNPPPQEVISLPYDYIKQLMPMKETTSGLVTIGSSSTTVIGSADTKFLMAKTGDYIRIDSFGKASDSEWYRIQTISSNSSLTLSLAFGLSGANSANYTICSAPDMPSRMHPAILYGALLQLTTDQNDPAVANYQIQYAKVMSDGKRIYKTRNYSQEISHIGEEYQYRR